MSRGDPPWQATATAASGGAGQAQGTEPSLLSPSGPLTLLWLSGNCHKAGQDPNEAGAPEKKERQARATHVHQLSDGSSSRTNASAGGYGKSRPASRGRVTVLQQTGYQNSPQGPRSHLLRPGTSHCRRSGLGPPRGLTGRWVFRCLQAT